MANYQINSQSFSEELNLFFNLTNNHDRVLKVEYEDQRACVFLETEQDPAAVELPQGVQIGYLLHQNQLYFKESNADVQPLNALNDIEVGQLKNSLNYQGKEFLLHESQLAYLSQLTDHKRKKDFLEIKRAENGDFVWRFGDEELEHQVEYGRNENLHPVLAVLYDTLWTHNQKKSHSPQRTKENINADGVYHFQMPAKTRKQRLLTPFAWLISGIKAIVRFLLLDNFIFKYTIGVVIATIANYGNPHYRTEPGVLSDVLARLIFPGGAKKPIINQEGTISLDSVLSMQFNSVRLAEKYRNEEGNFVVDNLEFSEFSIPMPEGSAIASIEACNALSQDSDPADCVYVIAFNGNSGTYQAELEQDAHALNHYNNAGIPVKLVRFNYPGVLEGSNRFAKPEFLIQAGIAQVERLLADGVPLENIQFQGISLGGSISSHVASFYHQRKQEFGALSVSRTFSSTTNVGLSYVKKVPYLGPLLAIILRPVLAFGLGFTHFQLDTASHYASLPDDKVWYTVARSPKHVRKAYSRADKTILDDNVLVYESSLHKSWRLQLKHVLAKYFGLFGYNKETYKEMNAAHKLVAVGVNGFEDYELNHALCAHADVYPFGLNKHEVQLAETSSPMLLSRHKELAEGKAQVKIIAQDELFEGKASIPIVHELGEQSTQFLVEHAPNSRDKSYFGRFFQEERSSQEKAFSAIAQTLINLTP